MLHFGLEQVGRGVAGALPGAEFDIAEHLPVLPVVRLDDLEGPQSVDDVAANERLIDVIGEISVPGGAQLVDRLLQGEVG
jgi:hypothetical protein